MISRLRQASARRRLLPSTLAGGLGTPRAEPLLGERLPSYPGPDEQWRLAHDADGCSALRGLAGGLAGLIAEQRIAPEGADRDQADYSMVPALARGLDRNLTGASVALVGEFPAQVRAEVEAAVTGRGARLVSAAFAGTDYFLQGDDAWVDDVTRLLSSGTKRLGWPLPPQGQTEES